MPGDIEEKVAEQKVYLTPLPGEAAKKKVRRAFGTDRLLADGDLIGTGAG